MNQKINNIKPLQLSASLILKGQGKQSNKILMLKRNNKISFPNTYVFPGGKCEETDRLNQKQFVQYGKITAIRQTLQQTGILMVPQAKQIDFKSINNEIIAQLWKDSLEELQPVIRFLTVQSTRISRYDCIFYKPTCRVCKYNTSNINKNNLSQIKISSQSTDYIWVEPAQMLQKFRQGAVNLWPPQILILTVLSKVELNCIDIKSYQPMMMDLKFEQIWLLYGDQQYPLQKMIQNQPQSASKRMLINYIENNKKKSKQRRIFFNKNIIFITDGIQQSLLKYLQLQSKL